MRSRAAAFAGSALFFIAAPGTVAGYLPWLIGRWRHDRDFGSSPLLAIVGATLILAGLAALIESFMRFAWIGRGTPAPLAPTERLVVSGLYRQVRNPMYVAVVAIILGQALWFGQAPLLAYAGVIWASFHLFVIFYEEPTLRRRYGDAYDRYRRSVPRWMPRFLPWDGGQR